MMKSSNTHLAIKSLSITILSCTLFFGFLNHSAAQNVAQIEKVLTTTFAKSPNVKISALSIDFQQGRIMQAEGAFNPELNFAINKNFNLSPSSIARREGWLGLTQNESFKSDILDYNLSVSKRFQTGTLIRPSLALTNFGRDVLFEDLSNAGLGEYITNRGKVFIDVTQPLLQGRGKKYYGATLEIEQLRLSAAQLDYAFRVSNQAYNVLLNYLAVVSARKDLEIQEAIEKNYEDFEKQLKLLSEKDVVPKAELTFINANLTAQHASVQNSKSAYRRAKNRLIESMGVSTTEVDNYDYTSMEFGIDSLPEEVAESYLIFWLEKASTTRGDYLAAQKTIASKNRNIEFAERQNKAKLDLTLGLGYNGIYESTSFEQYVAPFYSNIPGMSYRAGLVFQWPMGMKTTKGAYATALADKQTSEEFAKSLELNIQQQLSSSFNDIVYYNNAVRQSRLSVDFNYKARDNEYLKLQLGTSTVVNLVQVQNNYSFAQTSLNRLKLALNTALVKFRYESGNLIKITEENKIVVDVDEIFTLPKIEASE